MRAAMAALTLLLGLAQAPTWQTAAGGDNLIRPAFWEAAPGATANGSSVAIAGSAESAAVPQVDRYGPRVRASGDFGVTATLESPGPDLAVLDLVDGVPADQWNATMRRVEVGTQAGQVVFSVFDGTSADPLQPPTQAAAPGAIDVAVYKEGAALVLDLNGAEIARVADPGVFQTGVVLFGYRVAEGNTLSLSRLDVVASQSAPVTVGRCTPTRLLAGGADAQGEHEGLWWIWPDDGFVREIEPDTNAADYLVDVSPDQRWVTYYQGPANYDPATQRFVVDTWVMDLLTDERVELVPGNSPIGWISDSTAIVLGERPASMALVPSGEIVPSQGTLVYAQSMRAAVSPDQRLKAVVDRTPQGAAGISILDAASSDEVLHIQTGRGAPQLAWSPDSTRLAFTSGNDSATGLLWRLRLMKMTDQRPTVLASTQDLSLHSVLWAPPLGGCS